MSRDTEPLIPPPPCRILQPTCEPIAAIASSTTRGRKR